MTNKFLADAWPSTVGVRGRSTPISKGSGRCSMRAATQEPPRRRSFNSSLTSAGGSITGGLRSATSTTGGAQSSCETDGGEAALTAATG